MAYKKISQLSSATTPLAGTEEVPVVQSGVTKKVTVANLVDGRTISPSALQDNIGLKDSGGTQKAMIAPSLGGSFRLQGQSTEPMTFWINNIQRGSFDNNDNLNVDRGNLVIGTSGKGIDFSATGQAGGMTSELLNDYEEGTWTPGQGAGLTVVGAFSSAGKYTKIGRAVTLTGYIAGATSVAFAANAGIITGLPYTADTANGKPIGVGANAANSAISGIEATNTALNGVVALAATTRFDFTITYTI